MSYMRKDHRDINNRKVQREHHSDESVSKNKNVKVDPETVKAVRETVEQYEEALLELAKR